MTFLRNHPVRAYPDTQPCCYLNACSCTNGVAALGAECHVEIHNEEFCTSCDTNSTLVNNVCVENDCGVAGACDPVTGSLKVCACANGSAAYGIDCANNDDQFCTSCNVGSVIVNNVCVVDNCDVADSCDEVTGSLKVCSCVSGAATFGSACPGNNQEYCASCNVG